MDKLREPRFHIRCAVGDATAVVRNESGIWEYADDAGGLQPNGTAVQLAVLLQEAREIIHSLMVLPPWPGDRLAEIIKATDFLVNTGVCGAVPPAAAPPAPAALDPLPRALDPHDACRHTPPPVSSDFKVWCTVDQHASVINALVAAVEQLRRQQAGGSGG